VYNSQLTRHVDAATAKIAVADTVGASRPLQYLAVIVNVPPSSIIVSCTMKREETVDYLANIYSVVEADGIVERVEQRVFEEIATEIGAGYFERSKAIQKSQSEELPVALELRWSEQIRNLEDMLFVAYCDGTLEPTEKQAIITYANFINISQTQLSVIRADAKRRFAEYKG
jgi:uncharacterized tellurite resistance protein B-like protein